MTSIERIQCVLNGKMPDRLPVIPQSFMFAASCAGTSIGKINRNPRLMAESHVICQSKYGYDACVIDVDDATLAEACGAKVNWREDAVASVNEHEPILKDLRDIDELELPDPLKSGRMCEWLEVTERLRSEIGDHVWIMGRADQGPFSLLSLLRGTTNFMEDLLLEDEDVVFHAIEWAAKAHIIFGKAQLSAGAHSTSMGDSYASTDLISPNMFRNFAAPYEKMCVQQIQTDSAPYFIHICGDTTNIIGDMAATGARVLEVDWKIDMGRARQLIPESTVLMGNVNPSDPLVFGTPEQIKAEVKNIIDSTLGYGVIISSGCAMGPNTPPENFAALVSATAEYGTAERLLELREKAEKNKISD